LAIFEAEKTVGGLVEPKVGWKVVLWAGMKVEQKAVPKAGW